MKKTIKNILSVATSNLVAIASGVVVGLLLPKIISVSDYGWYKTFTLYTTYIGLCSLGIIDGIVLEYGQLDYSNLDRKQFRSYFRWYLSIHIVFALLIIFASLLIRDSDYKFIFMMIGLYLISTNLTGYFQQISQFTQRFKEFSLRKILNSVLRISIVFILYAIGKFGGNPNYKIYLLLFVIFEAILTVWYILTYRDIVFGEYHPLMSVSKQVLYLSKIGFPLLFANLCSTLILTLDRQFVSVLFNTEEYAVYAFAYNMLSLVTVAVSAISTVLYPTLKRTSRDTIHELYDPLIGFVTSGIFLSLVVFFPLSGFVDWFLPKYHDSLQIFRIIFPGLAISSAITIVMHNYYKVLGESTLFFKKSVIALAVSASANYIAYIIFKTTEAISIASIITIWIWYFLIEGHFIRKYQVTWIRNAIYSIIMMSIFYAITSINNLLIAGFAYFVIAIGVSAVFYKKDASSLLLRRKDT